MCNTIFIYVPILKKNRKISKNSEKLLASKMD